MGTRTYEDCDAAMRNSLDGYWDDVIGCGVDIDAVLIREAEGREAVRDVVFSLARDSDRRALDLLAAFLALSELQDGGAWLQAGLGPSIR